MERLNEGDSGRKARPRAVLLGAIVAAVAIIAGVLGSGGATAGTAIAAKGPEEQRRPNVVVIMTDDQTVEAMRVMPKAQRLLSDRGVTFRNSFASNPVCCPSRATFLSGRYAHNNGVFRNSPPNGGFDDFDGDRALPVALRDSGYFTAHVGKYLNGYGSRSDPNEIPPGWSEWFGAIDPGTYRMYGYTLNENGTLVTYGDYDTPEPANYQTDVLTSKATDLIARRAPRSKPFFLSLGPLASHTEVFRRPSPGDDDTETPRYPNPRPAPRHAGIFDAESLPKGPAYDEEDVSDKPAAIQAMAPADEQVTRSQRRRYRSRLGSLLAVDDMVQRVLRALRRAGELDNTLIVFTSDNGFLLGEHRIRSGKQYPYEESVRVPLVLRGPGIPHGEVRRSPAANVDLAPTILDYAEAEPRVRPDGRSLRSQIEDKRLEPGRAIVLENWCQVEEPCFDPDVPRYRGVRTGRYVYLEYPQTGERELYDLRRDPNQLESVHAAPAYDKRRQALERLLGRLRDCRGGGCRVKPKLKLGLEYEVDRVGGRRCTASKVVATVEGADAGDAVSARFFLPGRRVTDSSRPLRQKIRRNALKGGSRTKIVANVSVLDGRIETVAGRVPRPC